MERDQIDQLFEALARPVEPAPGLNGRVLSGVYKAERLRRRRAMIFHSIAFSILSALAVWFGGLAFSEMARSGFGHFMSMLWTDSSVAVSNMSDWGLALLETMPLMQLAWSALFLYLAVTIGLRLLRDGRPRLPMGVM